MRYILISLFIFMALGHIHAAEREKYNFNSDWKLKVGDIVQAEEMDYPDAEWKSVTLPHAFNEDEAFKLNIKDLTDTIVWYRKHFRLPADAKGRKVFIEFEGARQGIDLYVNGHLVGQHENGVMAFGFDLTAFVKPGKENVIAARIDNNWDYAEKATGVKYQWSNRNFNANYGGLPKNVWLHVTDKLYQTLPLYSNLQTTGVYIYAEDIQVRARKARIHAESEVKNETKKSQTVGYLVELFDRDGKLVKAFYGEEKKINPGEKIVLSAESEVEPLIAENSNETEIPLINKESVRLKHLQNNFNISFNIQDYSLNERVEYAYMLKGLENAWYTVKEPNNVTFRNLPPGKYEFLIKTRIRNQEWSNEISSIEIIIAPPLWLSWWAKLLYVFCAVGLLFIGLWAYKRKLNLEYLYESEKKSHEQEQELNDERLRFYTNITHELRTPLTLILGPLEDLVKSNTLSSKDHHRISVIHQSAVRLLNLINQILDFRKTETQNKKLCVTKGNLTNVIYETGLKYKELNNKPEIQVLIEAEDENMVLFFDKEIITMILDNLISNAIKYTEKGYIRIRAEWITENGIRYAQLSVEDTGYGIGQEALTHIFERYYQESGEHQASGTGIGLALVKNLVKLHEGDIQVKSLPDIGTTFYLRLLAENTYPQALHGEDMHAGKQDVKEKYIEKLEISDPDRNARPIILVVEDNADIRDYIADSFTDLYEVKTAANGKEGLQIATECIPDIVVSDIMMPVMNGIMMCQKLKADMRTSHIPVILLTAKDSITDKEEGYQAGADSYLTKPFSASLLQSRISNLLTQRRLLSERFAIRPEKPEKQSMEKKRAIITESMNKLDKAFMDKITNAITESLATSENVDITVLSNVMCMSSSTLYRKVKALTGMSTNEYIRKIKMQLAEKYLLEGKYSISEIAFKVGINSSVYFRQCFKEEFGMSASEYLKQLTGQSIDEKTDEK